VVVVAVVVVAVLEVVHNVVLEDAGSLFREHHQVDSLLRTNRFLANEKLCQLSPKNVVSKVAAEKNTRIQSKILRAASGT
jgi:hypothetical protein